jgi:putative membrane protein
MQNGFLLIRPGREKSKLAEDDRDMSSEEASSKSRVKNRRVHLANERTFLAWVRTSISIMAFGFVMERFSLFLAQFNCFLKGGEPTASSQSQHAHISSILGIVLIGFGALMGLLAFVRYKKVEKQIEEDTYHPSLVLDLLLALCVVVIGLFFVIYFVHSAWF